MMSSQRFKDTNNSKSSRSDINMTEILGVPSSIMEEKSRKTSTNANNSIRTSLSKSSESQKTNSFNSRIKNKQKVNIKDTKLNKIEEVGVSSPFRLNQDKKSVNLTKITVKDPKIPLKSTVRQFINVDVLAKAKSTNAKVDIHKKIKPSLQLKKINGVKVSPKAIVGLSRKKVSEAPKSKINVVELVPKQTAGVIFKEENKVEEVNPEIPEQIDSDFLDNHLLGANEEKKLSAMTIAVNLNSTSNISMIQETFPLLD